MHFTQLGLSGMAALTLLGLAAAPAAVQAQIVTPEPCWNCRRIDDFDRLDLARVARERAEERARDRTAQAEERARRLADARSDREFEARMRADDRARDRTAQLRDNQLRVQLRADEARDRALDRAEQARERAADRARIRPPLIHWMTDRG
jgi:hypothetical protein